jgi:hypothetical protein
MLCWLAGYHGWLRVELCFPAMTAKAFVVSVAAM